MDRDVSLSLVMFGLYALHQSIIMAQDHSHFRLQGFGIVNALCSFQGHAGR